MGSYNNMSVESLRRALEIKEKLASLENELSSLLGGERSSRVQLSANEGQSETLKRGRGRPAGGGMSAGAKARIAAAQKARWANFRAQKGSNGASTPASKKQVGGGMSAEGRARIAAAQKARWAKFHKANR